MSMRPNFFADKRYCIYETEVILAALSLNFKLNGRDGVTGSWALLVVIDIFSRPLVVDEGKAGVKASFDPKGEA